MIYGKGNPGIVLNRGDSAFSRARAVFSISSVIARARPATVHPLISLAISFNDSKSSDDAAGNPAVTVTRQVDVQSPVATPVDVVGVPDVDSEGTDEVGVLLLTLLEDCL